MAFEVNDNGPVRLSTTLGPIVDTDDVQILDLGIWLLTQEAQQRMPRRRHA
jgi:hypothetical protein